MIPVQPVFLWPCRIPPGAHPKADSAIFTGRMIFDEIGVASPIIGYHGRARAAVQCSVSARTRTRDRIVAEILPRRQDTANAISPRCHAPGAAPPPTAGP